VSAVHIPIVLARALHRESGASAWSLSVETFAARLMVSAAKRVEADPSPAPQDVEAFVRSLHLSDLALACACAAGQDAAWEHFVKEMRPALYAAARAMAPPDRARDLADSLYARLLGVDARGERRSSLFDYYHGRAKLSTWLRTVLAQRHVDELRQSARTVPLEDEQLAEPSTSLPLDPDVPERLEFVQQALNAAIAALEPRDRMRLRLYYAQGVKLAAIGRLTGESEATVSRKLDRTRQAIRADIERRLREDRHLSPQAVASCLADAAGAVELDVSRALAADDG
jgi:RNA polymerase sigma-70 factor (ECF subfamily)